MKLDMIKFSCAYVNKATITQVVNRNGCIELWTQGGGYLQEYPEHSINQSEEDVLEARFKEVIAELTGIPLNQKPGSVTLLEQ